MPPQGVIVPVKDSVFELGDGQELACEDVELTVDIDLVDISTNASGGHDELEACFDRASVSAKGPWRAKGIALQRGQTITFRATVIATLVVIELPVKIAKITLSGSAKNVWRFSIDGKTSGAFDFDLPGP